MAPHLVFRRGVVDGIAGKAELRDAVHIPVIGEGDGWHTQVDGALDHIFDTRGTVEHRVLAMVVQVDERHVLELQSDVL